VLVLAMLVLAVLAVLVLAVAATPPAHVRWST
jgi:hypothetical protein